VDAYRVAVNYNRDPILSDKIDQLLEKISEVKDRKSDDLYLQALDASQNGLADKAIELCKEALRLNPDNIQAQRMLERLQSRIPS
jgi:cytochrome c-type biogenesis protein CcmH/NrfG